MATTEWAKAVKNKKKKWLKARKAKPGFDKPNIDDGNYMGKVSMEVKLTGKDNVPTVIFTTTVSRGKKKGTRLRHTIWLENKDGDEDKEQQSQDDLSKRLQVLGINVNKVDLEKLPEIAKKVNKSKPEISITTREWDRGVNVYFNEAKDDDDEVDDDDDDDSDEDEDDEDEDNEEEEESDDEDEDEDEDSEDDEDEEEEDEEEEETVEKGMTVKYRRGTFKVTSSNSKKKTCSLKNKKGTTYKDVDWGKVVIEDNEEEEDDD